MQKLLIGLVLVLTILSQGCLTKRAKTSLEDFEAIPAPEYKINLDLSPSQRFNHLPRQFCKVLSQFRTQYYQDMAKGLKAGHFELFLSASKSYISKNFNTEFVQEMVGLAHFCELDLEYIFAYNYVYELSELGCTSIIWKSKNKLQLASNLDYHFPEVYRALTFKAIYTRKGVTVMTSNQMFGFVGFSRAYKQLPNGNSLSLALNARSRQFENLKFEILTNSLLDGSNVQVIYFFRSSFLGATDYDHLSQTLQGSTRLASACYLILNDDYRGMVIERGIASVHKAYEIDLDSSDKWFLVQTNFDRDMTSVRDLRKKVPEAYLKDKGKGTVATMTLFKDILSNTPNFMLMTRLETISSNYVDENGNFNLYIWRKKATTQIVID